MYRKTFIALACAVISAPAFAQSECPHQLTTRPQGQCSYLTPPADLRVHSEPQGYGVRPDWKPLPQLPSGGLQLPDNSLTRHGTVNSGISEGLNKGGVAGVKGNW